MHHGYNDVFGTGNQVHGTAHSFTICGYFQFAISPFFRYFHGASTVRSTLPSYHFELFCISKIPHLATATVSFPALIRSASVRLQRDKVPYPAYHFSDCSIIEIPADIIRNQGGNTNTQVYNTCTILQFCAMRFAIRIYLKPAHLFVE